MNATKQARAQLDEAVHNFNETVLTAVQETDNAMNNYRNSIKQIVALREVRNQGQETLKLSLCYGCPCDGMIPQAAEFAGFQWDCLQTILRRQWRCLPAKNNPEAESPVKVEVTDLATAAGLAEHYGDYITPESVRRRGGH